MDTKFSLSSISNFYKNNKKTIYIILVSVIILSLIISIKSCVEHKTSMTNLKIANDSLNLKIQKYVDDSNFTHSQIRQLELTNKELKTINSNLSTHYKNTIDSLGKVLKVKSNQIVEYISIINSAKGSGTTPLIPVKDTNLNTKNTDIVKQDSEIPYEFKVKDGYLLFDGVISPTKDSLKYAYIYTDKLILTNFYKKKGLFGLRKEYYWDGVLSNPNAQITGMEQLKKVQSRYKHWTITLGTSYGIDQRFRFTWMPITITAGYKLFEF